MAAGNGAQAFHKFVDSSKQKFEQLVGPMAAAIFVHPIPYAGFLLDDEWQVAALFNVRCAIDFYFVV